MKAAVLVFPGSNCDRDLAVAFRAAGFTTDMVWHKDTSLPKGIDVVGVPGGFSFGDYLRCGAIAARAPIIPALREHVNSGGYAIGICNGFQVLLETGLLPGVLMRNAGLKFICRPTPLEVVTPSSDFTCHYSASDTVMFPGAHHDGNYIAEADTLTALNAEDRVAFRYQSDVNGSAGRIAGGLSEKLRVLGRMPHPERAADAATGSSDGARLFAGLSGAFADA